MVDFTAFGLKKDQKGLTFIELLIAMPIAVIIGAAIVMSLAQVFSTNTRSQNHLVAVKQVEVAMHYINRDAEMSYPSKITPRTGAATAFPLTLEWYDLTNVHHRVVYSLVTTNGLTSLQRTETIGSASPVTTNIARYIDANSANSFYSFDGTTLVVQITATVGGSQSVSETRTLNVVPRTTQ